VAVRLADAHGRAGAMRRWLFSREGDLDFAAVERAATEVGRVDDFARRYSTTLKDVEGDADLAGSLHVTSVPTMFINGRRIDGTLRREFLAMALEYELSR